MRVLVADELSASVPNRLHALGYEVTVDPSLKGSSLTARIRELDPEVLVVRSTRVTADDIGASKSLALVIRAGAGVNTIDLAAASARGIYVTNCPGKNAVAVAELTFAHLLNLDRRISDNVAQLRAHRWNKKELSRASGLRGRKLAVLGCGSIGVEVIARAQAFGMHVIAWSRSLEEAHADALGVDRAASPKDAVRDADAITVHLALAPETRGLVGVDVFDAMRDGALFINTSRAEIVDEAAMRAAIANKNLRVGLDVFMNEPAGGTGDFTNDIVDLENVYGTHHIGASTLEAEEAVGDEVVRIGAAYRRGDPIPNCVNLATATPATHVLIVRHADRVGVLAHVLDALREAGHNVQQMQNIVFSGAEAACARIAITGAPTQQTIDRIVASPAVFAASTSSL